MGEHGLTLWDEDDEPEVVQEMNRMANWKMMIMMNNMVKTRPPMVT